jgi:glycosyltransferase involved in cell wall biosynthesis
VGASEGAPMLSTVLIARNEAPRLPAALASVGRLGEIVVCDTGSQDETIDVAERAGARVVEARWPDDFAAARSAAQRHARFPWIMRMDADEVLCVDRGTPDAWLSAMISRAEAQEADRIFVLRRYSHTNIHWFPRLFRADRYRWVGPVHELIVPIGEQRRAMAAPGAVFIHRPSPRVRGYADMVARHLQQKPSDPHLRYYLARSLWEERRWEEAVPALRAYLAGRRDYRYHQGEAHRMLGVILAANESKDAVRHLEEAARGDGFRAEAALDLVRLWLARGQRAIARRWIDLAANASPPRERAPWGGTTVPYLLEIPAWCADTWRTAWRRAS